MSKNYNSNDFFMGVDNNYINPKPSNSLITHINNIKNEQQMINSQNTNNKNTNNKKSINVVVNEIVQKLENKVYLLNNKIKNFNKEKKNIIELENKEKENLKDIIRKLYMLIVTINKSIDLKKEDKIMMLEKLRNEISSNEGLKRNIDEIMSNKPSNEVVTTKSNLKVLNIVQNVNNNILQSVEEPEKTQKINQNQNKNKEQSVFDLNLFYTNLKNNNSRKGVNNQTKVNNQNKVNNQTTVNSETKNNSSIFNFSNTFTPNKSNNRNSTKSNNQNISQNIYNQTNKIINNQSKQNKKPIINKIKNASITNKNAEESLNKYFL